MSVDTASITVDGYPLAAVARRHGASTCASCGWFGAVWRLNGEADDGRLTSLDICGRCVARRGGAWRLRFRPVPYSLRAGEVPSDPHPDRQCGDV